MPLHPHARPAGALILASALLGGPAVAQQFELGVHAGMSLSGGKPANDIELSGLQLRWRLDERSWILLGVQRQVFDFERPAAILGLQQDPSIEAIDAKARATQLSLGWRRELPWPGSRWGGFWELGVGTSSPKVPTVSGPLAGGGSFEIATRARRQWSVAAGAGLRYAFDARWSAEGGLQLEHHQADWRLRDHLSGRTGKVDAYQTGGLWLGLAARW